MKLDNVIMTTARTEPTRFDDPRRCRMQRRSPYGWRGSKPPAQCGNAKGPVLGTDSATRKELQG
jgi:hypothetical protein